MHAYIAALKDEIIPGLAIYLKEFLEPLDFMPDPQVFIAGAASLEEIEEKKKALSKAVVRKSIPGFPRARVISIVDGDTVIVAKGRSQVTIRLDSIDCPEDGREWLLTCVRERIPSPACVESATSTTASPATAIDLHKAHSSVSLRWRAIVA
jgi:hypothetical protein